MFHPHMVQCAQWIRYWGDSRMKPSNNMPRIFLSILLIQLPALFHNVQLLLSSSFSGRADFVVVERPVK